MANEPIVKTKEHRLMDGMRKTIYRETSADLVKTADGGNVEAKLASASPFLDLGDVTDYIDIGGSVLITDTALIAKLEKALDLGCLGCRLAWDSDSYVLPIFTHKYSYKGSIYCAGGDPCFVREIVGKVPSGWHIQTDNLVNIMESFG